MESCRWVGVTGRNDHLHCQEAQNDQVLDDIMERNQMRVSPECVWIEGKLKLTRGTRNGVCNMPLSYKWMHELVVLPTLRIRPSGTSSKDDVANREDTNARVWSGCRVSSK